MVVFWGPHFCCCQRIVFPLHRASFRLMLSQSSTERTGRFHTCEINSLYSLSRPHEASYLNRLPLLLLCCCPLSLRINKAWSEFQEKSTYTSASRKSSHQAKFATPLSSHSLINAWPLGSYSMYIWVHEIQDLIIHIQLKLIENFSFDYWVYHYHPVSPIKRSLR